MAALLTLCAAAALAQTSGYQQGLALFEKGQAEAAIPFLVRATEQNPRDAQAWKTLGVVYASRGQYELAAAPFHHACELAPKLEDACYYEGRALYAINRFEPSLAALTRALSADPASWKVPLGMAQALEALGRAEDAEREFKKTLSLCRNSDSKPGAAYGLFLVRQGRLDEAAAPLEEVLARFPASFEAHLQLGRVLFDQGKIAAAIPHLERAVSIDPASAQAHILLAKAYTAAGRAAEAQPHFEAAARYESASQTTK